MLGLAAAVAAGGAARAGADDHGAGDHDHEHDHGRLVLSLSVDPLAAPPADARSLAAVSRQIAFTPLAFPFPRAAKVTMGGGPAAHASRQFGPQWRWYNEQAYDIHARAGTPVLAVASGVVTLAVARSTSSGRSYGSSVFVRADDGTGWAYLHLGPQLRVRRGHRVLRGQQLGTVGAWRSGSPHLHLAATSRTRLDGALRAAVPGTITRPPVTRPEKPVARPVGRPLPAVKGCATKAAKAPKAKGTCRPAQPAPSRPAPPKPAPRPTPPRIHLAAPLAVPAGHAAFGRASAEDSYFLSSDRKRASRFTLGEHALVTHLAALVDGHGEGAGSSQRLRLVVFGDSHGFPARLLAHTAAHTIVRGAAPAWVTLPLAEPLRLTPGTYHLGIHSGPGHAVGRYGWARASEGTILDDDGFANGTRGFRSPAMFDVGLAVQALYQPQAPPAPPAPDCGADRFRATYWANRHLAGTPVRDRCESRVSYDWRDGSPHSSVPRDEFSVRWSGSFAFAAGTHRFTVRGDDGVRLWIGGRLVIDAWREQSPTTYTATVPLDAGRHDVLLEYYEAADFASVSLRWELLPPPPGPPPVPTCAAGQFRATYWANRHLSGTPVRDRCESRVAYDWGEGSPSSSVPRDDFSARWAGLFDFARAGDHRFTVRADDGVRLWVGGRLVIDAWRNSSATTHTATVALDAGRHEVRLEYYEATGAASVLLGWEHVPAPAPAPSPAPAECELNRFRATYFPNRTLSGAPVRDRCESRIAYDWGDGSPHRTLPHDDFSVRWAGRFAFSRSALYRFAVRADDGVRLWVDDELVIDAWTTQSATVLTAEVELEAGEHDLRLEYFEATGRATVALLWERVRR